MKNIKKIDNWTLYENNSNFDWREDLFKIRDMFFNIEENLPERSWIKYNAGIRTSSNSFMYTSHISNNTIVGNPDFIDPLLNNGRFVVCVHIYCHLKNSNYSPFNTTNYGSYYDDNLSVILNLLNRINYIKRQVNDYKMGISIDNSDIKVYFLRNKNTI